MPEVVDFWNVDASEVAKRFGTDVNLGLSVREVLKRREEHGVNLVPEKDARTKLDIFVAQFTGNAFLYVLFAASVVSLFLGDIAEAVTIFVILLGSGLLGFYQEYRSENAIRELKKFISRKATVMREGKQEEVNASDLVPGDIVLLEVGDVIPADVRLIRAEEFVVDESAVTGESQGMEKKTSPLGISKPQPYQLTNYALMGTTVNSGFAKGVVVATGVKTQFGSTATLLSAKMPESDFQLNLRKFSELMLKVIVVLTGVVFVSNTVLNHGLFESLLFALAVAVGIAPEMLPVITTVTLSRGALKMAEQKVVVKKLATIEDIGNMNVLCMDKTGTLTEPELQLEGAFDTSGHRSSERVLEYGLVCNHAHSRGKKMAGNLFDVAVVNYAKRNAVALMEKPRKLIDDVEFDYDRRRMSVVMQDGNGQIMITKGEPLSVLGVCRYVESAKSGPVEIGVKKREIEQQLTQFAEEGYSVLAVAAKKLERKTSYTKQDETGLTLVGFLLFKSQIKKSATSSISKLKALGVSLVLLTGDDPAVTRRLCKDAGLQINGEKIITGTELDQLNDAELRELVQKYNIYARVTPIQKVRVLEAIRKNDNIVGFMGDGVNDAPALRLADVGISVDTAQDIAKEAADIVLTKKSLEVVASGIREGRKTFGNITKYILNTISANYGNITTVVLSSFFLPFIPLLPVQILLNNFMSDIPNLAIATDNVDEQFIQKPKRWNLKMIYRFMIVFGLISAIFDLLTILPLLYIFGVSVAVLRTLWFLESMMSEVFVALVIRTKLPFWKSRPSNLLITSSIFVVTMGIAVVSLPAIGKYFDFVPPEPIQVLGIAGLIGAYCIVTELAKQAFFKHYKQFNSAY